MLRVLTYNAGLLRVTVLGRTLFEVPHVSERLPVLPSALQALEADVLCLQEVFTVPHRDRLVEALRATHAHVAREDGRPRRGYTHGLLVLSRHPLRDAVFTPFDVPRWQRLVVRQGVLSATVDVPGDGPVQVLDAHTTAGWGLGPERPAVERARARQLAQAAALAVPAVPTLLCGDLNAGPQASAGNFAALLAAGFSDPLAGSRAVTWDPANALNSGGVFASSPAQRVDHVLLDRQAAARWQVLGARVVHDEPTVAVGTARVTLSDHAGVLVDLG